MKTTRRQFIARSASAVAFPMVVPGSVLGKDGTVAPSNRITMACIGVGGQGQSNLHNFLQDERVQVTAICDVDTTHRDRALQKAGLQAEAGYGDFREVVKRDDVDTVMIATPDHWHALITAAAVRAGKDIYCEKPITGSIGEGRFISDLVKKHSRVLQCGTWRRSSVHTRMGCEWVRNGYIGDLQEIEVGVKGKFAVRGGFTGLEQPAPVPETLDWSLWQGPAPEAAYTPGRCHFNFRWVLDYAPGYITDWGVHFIDIAQWGNGTDNTTPVEVSAVDVISRDQGYYNAPESFTIHYTYANGVRMKMFSTTDSKKLGIKFIGKQGSVFTENTRLETEPIALRQTRIREDEIHLYVSNHHHRNFIDCVQSRKPTAANVESAHRGATTCYLGAISAALNRPLKFDPVKEHFIDDPEANQRLMRSIRAPWKLG